MRDEGYIKFRCDCEPVPPPPWHELHSLNEWRQRLYEVGLIGAYTDGIGFGNVSIRGHLASEFIITGSGTGSKSELKREHFTRVVGYDLETNHVICEGPTKPSSESLTHAAFYDSSRAVQAVVHVHHQALWAALMDRVPTTSKDVAYGTPEMALEIGRIIRENPNPPKQICVMAGHEEGLISWGDSIGHAAAILLGVFREVNQS